MLDKILDRTAFNVLKKIARAVFLYLGPYTQLKIEDAQG